MSHINILQTVCRWKTVKMSCSDDHLCLPVNLTFFQERLGKIIKKQDDEHRGVKYAHRSTVALHQPQRVAMVINDVQSLFQKTRTQTKRTFNQPNVTPKICYLKPERGLSVLKPRHNIAALFLTVLIHIKRHLWGSRQWYMWLRQWIWDVLLFLNHMQACPTYW